MYTLDGKHVATNDLNRKGKGDYGGTFTFAGRRIYVRVQQSLLCIEASETGGGK